MSVSVKKHGNEVSISSHMIRDNRLKNLLQDHKMLWNRYGLDSSKNSTLAQGGSYVHTSYDPAISNSPRETLSAPSSSRKVDGVTLPSSEHSNGKGTDNSGDKQEILRKSLEENMAEAAKQDYGSGVGKERYDDVMIDLWDSCVFSVGTCLAKGLLLIVF